MSYLFNEAIPFGGTGGQFSGKNKGVLLTNTTGAAINADIYTYKANGTTAASRVTIPATTTEIFTVRVAGISCGSGLTGAQLS